VSALFPTPAADFDHPLEMLDDCHDRVRRNCALAGRIAEHLRTRGADEDAAGAARSVLRYFTLAARNHHDDEEKDLFPAMLSAADASERPAVQALVDRLVAEHVALGHLWAAMRTRLELVADGRDAEIPEAQAKEFAAAYERHIQLEEAELLPLAKRLLDPVTLARVGHAMAERRK
jgi:hemerythrin-like domain-containing protein